MSRARCQEVLADIKDSLKEIETLITNYRFKDARTKLLLTTQDMIDELDDELTEARKEQEKLAKKE